MEAVTVNIAIREYQCSLHFPRFHRFLLVYQIAIHIRKDSKIFVILVSKAATVHLLAYVIFQPPLKYN
jgi:hypothetical protein